MPNSEAVRIAGAPVSRSGSRGLEPERESEPEPEREPERDSEPEWDPSGSRSRRAGELELELEPTALTC